MVQSGFPCGSAGKESASNAGDTGLIPGLGRSLEKGKATHSSILAWRIPWTSPWVAKSRTWQSDFHFTFTYGSVQFSSVTQLCPSLCDPMDCSTPGFPVHYQLLEFIQTLVHWVGDAIQSSHPLSSSTPPTFNLSLHQVFSSESALHIRWPKNWNFSFNISPSNEYSGLISFRMDWLDLLAVQGTLKNLLQHHSSKASVLQCSAFFILQLSHPYWKNHSLD